MTQRVLITDDDAAIRTALADALGADGFTVTVADGAEAALARIEIDRPHVVLTDVRMGGMDGLEFLRLLRSRAKDIDVVVMTAFDDMPTVVSAMRDGAAEFISKPIDLHEVRAVLKRIFQDRRTRMRAIPAGDPDPSLSGLVGRSPAMIGIYKLIGHAAATRATVLIRGESGTGKELVARAIHQNSLARDEPFVAVNCAALPMSLLESELFGHVRGAFTGAVAGRRGRFAQAGAGTIFLDEIGDTSADFQSKLLRVLQDREYQPVGAERVEKTDARVIAATHQHLESLMADRRFRQDLYYRLRVVEIVLPPLRDRTSDIPLLVNQLLQRASRTLAAEVPSIMPSTMDVLATYPWPGNVRELENVIMRAVVLASGGVLRPEHIAFAPEVEGSHIATLEEVEREQLERALRLTDGHKARTAELLGVSRPRLNRLIEKHGLEPQ